MSPLFRSHCRQAGILPECLPNYIAWEDLPSAAHLTAASFFFFSNYSLLGNPRFSAWRPGYSPCRSSLLGEAFIRHSAARAAQQLRGAFPFLHRPLPSPPLAVAPSPSRDLLVLHLRAGDVSDLAKLEYATNPLCFYEALRTVFHRLVIVTQPGPEHILLRAISSLFESVAVVSGHHRDDFHYLASAEMLATSGVSTFPVAAALLSTRLLQLYASDAYLREHLNPLFLQGRCDVRLFRMPGFLRQWRSSPDRQKLLYHYRPPNCAFAQI